MIRLSSSIQVWNSEGIRSDKMIISGHPLGVFPSSPSAPRMTITNGMVRLIFDLSRIVHSDDPELLNEGTLQQVLRHGSHSVRSNDCGYGISSLLYRLIPLQDPSAISVLKESFTELR